MPTRIDKYIFQIYLAKPVLNYTYLVVCNP